MAGVAIICLTLFSGVALAATKNTGTGVWTYGTTSIFGGGTVYSRLTDRAFDHRSSVKNWEGTVKRSKMQPPGITAVAELPVKAFNTDYAYYYIDYPWN